ncbi:asparagine synthase C-terminal domain-containing protein [Luteimonas sp. BDR2-5]|uniref:asparagine synthase-related protein n=1 Tax=Proluteimonas luteida TaxID=2878685 RepID=UPI001E5F72C5|nr:asparagine synthase C-terminal domain-containing protein [Luteimonas sp. BDR2-5]MCD9026730.1 asparagine synthase C-terminal domain-containing protein [Luteimonas sp. BDR2-5]
MAPEEEVAALTEQAILLRFSNLQISVFTAETTLVLKIPGGGLLVGHLFTRNGKRFSDGAFLPAFGCHAECLKHLFDQCWGEYLLIWPNAGEECGFSVTRDPSGAVPCVYSLDDGRGFVTSDISLATALGRYRRRVDWDAVALELNYSHWTSQHTALLGVKELLPGCSLHIRRSGSTTGLDWSPWTCVARGNRHTEPEAAAAEVRSTVQSVVGAWADVDRSILLELSGGLDSSIIAACLSDTAADVECCTLVSPQPDADERHYASLAANRLGVELRTKTLDVGLASFDFPPPPYLVRPRINALQYAINEATEQVCDEHGMASYYSGGGGDTVFGLLGNASPAADAFRERGLRHGMAAIRDLSELHGCTVWKAGRLTLRKLTRPPKPPWTSDASFLDPSAITATPDPHPWLDGATDALPGDRERIATLAGTSVFREGAARGQRRYLRLPLLSQPVLESCLRVPSWMAIRGGKNRAVARSAFADKLPMAIHARRSKGDFLQYCGAVFKRRRSHMLDFLLTGELEARGLLDGQSLTRFVASTPRPRDETFIRIFDLCVIENWLRHQS